MSLQPPLGSIALSLSGGGYRSAGFHLGVLDLLDDADKIPAQLLPLFEQARSLFEQLRVDPYLFAGNLTE